MIATIKSISIEQLAEQLEGKLWTKGDMKRIYLNDHGYNTKKMSTKTYVYQRTDGTFSVNCTIECPSQAKNWIISQEQEIVDRLLNKINEIIDENGEEIENQAIELEAKLESETQVQGYFMRWYEVKIPINSYGKLAIRKRQKVHTYKGAISKAPVGFIELNDNHFAQACEIKSKERLFEYAQTPTFND